MSPSGRTQNSPKTLKELAEQRDTQVKYFAIGLVVVAASALIWPLLGRGLSNIPFMPHTFCYLGNRTLITTHLMSDLLIGISYVVISATLVYMVRASRGGIPFHWLFLAFGTFIIACGGTHFMEAITLWHPIYWASAYVKVLTAVASVATAIALPMVMPQVLGNVSSVHLAEDRALELAKANQELSAANDKLQELDKLRRRFVAQAAANVGDWEWDLATGRVRWSPEVEDMHGYARGTFPGDFEGWAKTVHPDDREKVKSAALAAVQTSAEREYDIEYRTVRADGSIHWAAGRGAIEYDGSGKAVRMAGMCIDITTRKRTEEALRKTEKLAAAGRLAATIAHEINNPLEAVTNLLYLAKAEPLTDSAKNLLDMADRELQRVGHITRQTLGFYREASSPVSFELSGILKGIVDVFQGKLNSRQVTAKIEARERVHVYGVPGEMRQVFANLLSNAIDASPANSEICIRVKELQHQAQVTFADRGTGIPPEAQANLFEPFFTTKKDVGTGLGLWISRQIVESHGGSIRFRTRKGSGTVFVVSLSKGTPSSGSAN